MEGGSFDIPLVDLDGWRGAAMDAVDHALRTSGFLLLTGHGVEPSLSADLRAESLALFHGDASAHETPVGRPGWSGLGTEANAYASGGESPPDLQETLLFVRDDGTVLLEATGGVRGRERRLRGCADSTCCRGVHRRRACALV